METDYRIDVGILCGGDGTRIKHLTQGLPKCVVPIGTKPFLWFLLNQLHFYKNVNNIFLAVSDKGEPIQKELDKVELPNKDNIHFVTEEKPMGTLLGLLSLLPNITTSDLLVLNGDTYCKNFNFYEFYDFHHHNKNIISVAKYTNKNSGIWLVQTQLLDTVISAHAEGYDKEILLYHRWVQVGYYQTGCSFIDIGTEHGLKEMIREYSPKK
jgi:NDP-sugar pyrophosphorylase family protein